MFNLRFLLSISYSSTLNSSMNSFRYYSLGMLSSEINDCSSYLKLSRSSLPRMLFGKFYSICYNFLDFKLSWESLRLLASLRSRQRMAFERCFVGFDLSILPISFRFLDDFESQSKVLLGTILSSSKDF